MPISFANIPANIKVPMYYVEVDPSMAGLPSINLIALLTGIMTSDGTAVPDVPVAVGSQAMADQFFGPGSELSRMFQAFYSNNFANEVWALPMAEPPASTAATGTIDITADADAGRDAASLYVAGTHIPNQHHDDGHDRRRHRGRGRRHDQHDLTDARASRRCR